MPRRERPLPEQSGPLTEFAGALRELRQRAGNPTYRVIAQRAHYSIGTISGATGGRQLPSLDVTLAYVRACGGDAGQWERSWHETAARLAPASPPPPPAQDPAHPPYAGLAPFQRADADYFFGREDLVADLAARLGQRRFLALFGASGSGKSSVLRAGILPKVTDAVLFTPGPHPFEECAIHLAAPAHETPGRLLAELSADPRNLHRVIRKILADRPQDAELVLVVDQFEEVFTLCTDPAERGAFITALVRATEAPSSRCRVLLAVRADFYAHCTRHPDLVTALRDGQLPLGPMTGAQLRDAIVKPAERARLIVEGALLAHLTAQAQGQPGVLPLLSHALRETWHRRRGSALTLAAFQATGGMEDALARTAEDLYAGLTHPQQQLARQIFLRLTALGEGTEDTKRRLPRTELDDTPDTALVLDRAAHARLLTLDDDRIEIAHEALIRCWPRLHRWLAEDRDRLRTQRRLTEATALWQSLGHDPDTLYRGTRLAAARELPRPQLSRHERDFLDASTHAEHTSAARVRRQLRRVRRLAALLVVLLVVAATAFGYAVRAENAARRQRDVLLAQRVAGQAVALRESDPSLAAQLALAAYRLVPDATTRDGLLSTTTTILQAHLEGINTVVPAPDGRTLVAGGYNGSVGVWDITDLHHPAALTKFSAAPGASVIVDLARDSTTLAGAGSDGMLRLWNLTDPRHPTPYGPAFRGHKANVFAVAFSPDGHTLATGSYDHTARLWDVTDPRHPTLLSTLTRHTLNVKPVAFSPDGRTLATGSDDRTVRLWNITDPRHPTLLAVLTGHKDYVPTVAFSPDGHLLATGSDDRTIRLWDIRDPHHPTLYDVLKGPADVVTHVAFSPDSHLLTSSSFDRSVHLWDVTDPRRPAPLATYIGHHGATQSLAFTKDGREVISGSADRALRIWETTVPAASARACALTDRVISPAQWQSYLPGVGYRPPCPG